MLIKQSTGVVAFEVDFVDGMTVEDLKMIVGDMLCASGSSGSSIDYENLCFVSENGRVLRNDRDSLSSYQISDASTIILTISTPSSFHSNASSSSSSSGNNNRELLLGTGGGEDFMQTMFDNMDPELLQQIFFSNPQIQKLMEKQPEMRHLFADPSFIKQMMQASTDPDKMLELQRRNDLAMAQLENIPGGFQALTSFYRDMEEPLTANNLMQSETGEEDRQRRNRELARLYGVTNVPQDHINDIPLPNPWTQPPPHHPNLTQPVLNNNYANPAPIFPFFNAATSSDTTTTTTDTTNATELIMSEYRQKYRKQLVQLQELGYTDEQMNIRALLAAGGNVYAAVSYILSQLKK